MKELYMQYTYVLQLGMNEHKVSFYDEYSEEKGLTGPRLMTFTSPNKAYLFSTFKDNGIKLSPEQVVRLNSLIKAQEDGIVTPEGKYLKN